MAVRGRELVTLAILAVLLAPAAAVAEYRKLDGIVAVVDDDVVLASELMDRLDLVRRSSEEMVSACRRMTSWSAKSWSD